MPSFRRVVRAAAAARATRGAGPGHRRGVREPDGVVAELLDPLDLTEESAGREVVVAERAEADADADAHRLPAGTGVARPSTGRTLACAGSTKRLARKPRSPWRQRTPRRGVGYPDPTRGAGQGQPAGVGRRSRRRASRIGSALVAAAALAAAGCGGGGGDTTAAPPATTAASTTPATPAAPAATLAATAARVRRQLRGIPQRGLVLGSPAAPVTIIEYGDFACPRCAAVHRDVLPAVIARYVRTGKASLEFRGLAGETPSRSRDLALAHVRGVAAAPRLGLPPARAPAQPRRGRPSASAPTASPRPSASTRAASRATWRGRSGTTQVRAARSVAAATRMSSFPVFLVRARSKPGDPVRRADAPGLGRRVRRRDREGAEPGG